jgi:hypothetical protein
MNDSSQVISPLRQRMMEDMRLRNFQLHPVDGGTSPITLHATNTGLKFFFGARLDRGELMTKMKPVFVPRIGAPLKAPEKLCTLGSRKSPALAVNRLATFTIDQRPRLTSRHDVSEGISRKNRERPWSRFDAGSTGNLVKFQRLFTHIALPNTPCPKRPRAQRPLYRVGSTGLRIQCRFAKQ